ncbi:pyridoxamine 5'-phosphate oxidase [Actomonas aquatica]|uniref:Pyridoxamine 5'-phosphate oxidase n=1 Tax=Actomonas aquatica TaxID=2866162 RepID=A0ABZ1C6C1_9BACT|nr:pyridoxamine 5'-phosphate oxidase [Opitutus sp. WL0086]WRQ86079.1 pyridoxamine 5'-phosphate oxidase [Opitutus sp. WL0086]
MVDPLLVFQGWLQEAKDAGVREPTAMALATVDAQGAPAVRMVLLKHADERGFVFYTNLESDKGHQLATHARAELCFHWAHFERQVRVHGPVEPVTDAEADAYFASRAHKSKLGAWASQQSRPLESQGKLLKAVAGVALKHPLSVPRPPHWSGFRVVPDWIELWSAGEFRLHDRVRYTRDAEAEGGWAPRRLYP